ncbi:hypothetical protein THAOC_20874 [Thalassiosira oceanica]|uniref:Protein kinase domain-containing protein n=1 Tax=Thalassiosira oceanica TaxID=159749 RepID=K0RYT5_THAOC|nr:hypothetical protein THAOC_20874 [Thalassiosira oceanica]|eukprot:EJK58963.1 hypothetical protein THAOC_20874 [Thalassiosira oceanica]
MQTNPERKMEPVSDKNASVEQRQHGAASAARAPLSSKAPSFPPTFDGDAYDIEPIEPVSPSPLHARRHQQQHNSAVTNTITGCFSDISRRYSIDYSRVLDPGAGMTVCVGQDLETGKLFAIKTIVKGHHKQRNLHREVSLLRDLRDEAREQGGWRAGRCSGRSSVIELVDLHEDATNLHFVTELCRGGVLTDRICDRVEESERLHAEQWTSPSCFSDDDASKVLRQVLSALDFLHSRDICHRDVQPENILFLHPEGTNGPDGKDVSLTVRLIDLGAARYHHVSSFEPHMSTVVGNCTFIAPEVLRRHYDQRCDYWSLGVVAYVMMCGYPPFVGDTNEEVCEAVLKGRFRFDPKHWDDVSKDSEVFVRGLLKVNVKSRMGGEEAMEHPFIVDGGTRDEVGEEECGRIKRFHTKRVEREHSAVHLPSAPHLPSVHLPSVHLPSVHLPSVHLQKKDRLPHIGHKNTE